MGSSVPQWPTFFICRRRRTIATTSWEVIPAALSTSRTPSGVAVDDMANLLQNFLFYFRQRSLDPRSGRQLVPAAAELVANGAHVGRICFRAHAHAHFPFVQFFEEHRHHNTIDGADMIDQTFVVLGPGVQSRRDRQAQAEARYLSMAFETHRAEQLA